MNLLQQVLRVFFAWNRRVCDRIERSLPHARLSPFVLYRETAVSLISEHKPNLIVDVGGGRECSFCKGRPVSPSRVLAVDISEEQLLANSGADAKLVADLNHGLPLRDSCVDFITSSSVLEHLDSAAALFQSSRRALKDGGFFVHVFSCKYALFALINRMLPPAISQKVVAFFKPESRGICGFPAFYRDCYYSRIRALLKESGFEVVRLHPSFYQSRYYDFCVPLYMASALYELLTYWFRLNNLAAYLVVVACKRPDGSSVECSRH
jgi:SAM-dependent methyltransferase